MASLKELEKLMRGTKGIPIQYQLVRERVYLRRIRRVAQDYERKLKSIEEGVKAGSIEKTKAGILKSIKDLHNLGDVIQISEMKLVDRAVNVGNLLVKYKVETKGLDKFVKVIKIIKELTKENWDLVNTGLKREREALQQKLKAYGLMNLLLGLKKGPKSMMMEIEIWRRGAIEYAWTQRRALKNIKGLVDRIKKDEEAAGKLDASLEEFSDAVNKEIGIIHKMIGNFVMVFIELRSRYTDLKAKKGFPEDEKINTALITAAKNLSETSEVPAYRQIANIR